MMRVLASNCGAVLVASCHIALGWSWVNVFCGLWSYSSPTRNIFLGRGVLLFFKTISCGFLYPEVSIRYGILLQIILYLLFGKWYGSSFASFRICEGKPTLILQCAWEIRHPGEAEVMQDRHVFLLE